MTDPDRDFADYMRDEAWDDVVRQSAERLADPLPFALDALEDLFGHDEDKENGFVRFQTKLEQFLWWADDAVQCLERVLADPPDELGKLVRERAGTIWVETPEGERVGDERAHEEWLGATVPRLRAMFDAYVAEKSAEMKAQRGEP